MILTESALLRGSVPMATHFPLPNGAHARLHTWPARAVRSAPPAGDRDGRGSFPGVARPCDWRHSHARFCERLGVKFPGPTRRGSAMVIPTPTFRRFRVPWCWESDSALLLHRFDRRENAPGNSKAVKRELLALRESGTNRALNCKTSRHAGCLCHSCGLSPLPQRRRCPAQKRQYLMAFRVP
jgi:hypothetical protein